MESDYNHAGTFTSLENVGTRGSIMMLERAPNGAMTIRYASENAFNNVLWNMAVYSRDK